MDARRLSVEPLPAADGRPGKQMRVVASVAPADIERTLALLRGLGFSPSLIGPAPKGDASNPPGNSPGGSSNSGQGSGGAKSASGNATGTARQTGFAAVPQQ
jgi:hypothetical protein